MDELHERLDQEHTDALLKDYSADYETWLEDRVAELEALNVELVEAGKQLVDSAYRTDDIESYDVLVSTAKLQDLLDALAKTRGE